MGDFLMGHLDSAAALYQAEAENRHLEQTILALRSELEAVKAKGRENVQKEIAEHSGEIMQLKETARELRRQLERIDAGYKQRIHDMKREARGQMKQLQETITALRDKLDKPNG